MAGTSEILAVLNDSTSADAREVPVGLDSTPAQQGDQGGRQAERPQAWTRPPAASSAAGARSSPCGGSGAGCSPTRHRRQVAVLGLGVPERRALGQPQLGPAPAGLALLAGQPVAERVDEVIVGELVVTLAARLARAGASLAEPSGSVGVISRSSGSRMRIRSSKSRGRPA